MCAARPHCPWSSCRGEGTLTLWRRRVGVEDPLPSSILGSAQAGPTRLPGPRASGPHQSEGRLLGSAAPAEPLSRCRSRESGRHNQGQTKVCRGLTRRNQPLQCSDTQRTWQCGPERSEEGRSRPAQSPGARGLLPRPDGNEAPGQRQDLRSLWTPRLPASVPAFPGSAVQVWSPKQLVPPDLAPARAQDGAPLPAAGRGRVAKCVVPSA